MDSHVFFFFLVFVFLGGDLLFGGFKGKPRGKPLRQVGDSTKDTPIWVHVRA